MSLALIISIVINLLVVALPIIVWALAIQVWLQYRRSRWQYSVVNPVLFEIKIPAVVEKSPFAMESVLKALFDKSFGSKLETFKDGRVPPSYSLEIASFGGQIKFFVRTPFKFAKILQNQLYAQYPSVELEETDDYMQDFVWDVDKNAMWGGDFIPSAGLKDLVPIQTYKSYELDKNLKEEFQVDPFSGLMEYLGGLGYGEQCWIQILIRGNVAYTWKNGMAPPWNKRDTLKQRLEKFINDMQEGLTVPQFVTNAEGKVQEYPGRINTVPGADLFILGLRERQDMVHYDTYIRSMYLGDKEHFNGLQIPAMIKAWQQFSSANGNTLVPAFNTDLKDGQKDLRRISKTINKYYGLKRAAEERDFLAAFKRREAFYPPHQHKNHLPYVMSTQEIATLYHLPSSATTTPSLQRQDSRKVDPPANLPV